MMVTLTIINHQYTPIVSIYTSTMDPSWVRNLRNSMIPRLQLYAKGQLSKRNNAALVLGPNFTPLSKTSKFITPQPVTKGAIRAIHRKATQVYQVQVPKKWRFSKDQRRNLGATYPTIANCGHGDLLRQTPQIWSNSRQAKSSVDSWFLHKPQWRSCLFIVPSVVGCVQVRV